MIFDEYGSICFFESQRERAKNDIASPESCAGNPGQPRQWLRAPLVGVEAIMRLRSRDPKARSTPGDKGQAFDSRPLSYLASLIPLAVSQQLPACASSNRRKSPAAAPAGPAHPAWCRAVAGTGWPGTPLRPRDDFLFGGAWPGSSVSVMIALTLFYVAGTAPSA